MLPACILLLFPLAFVSCDRGPAASPPSKTILDKTELVFIPGRAFTRGSPEAGPAQPVEKSVVKGFWMARFETTVDEFARYLNETGREDFSDADLIERVDGIYTARDGRHRLPLSGVTMTEAMDYAKWLGGKTGARVRLPTETEWEFAARGGIRKARYPWGWGTPTGRANYESTGPRPVGSYPPNAFGLYDMAGNVFEWCWNPEDSESASQYSARGGSWAERDATLLAVFRPARFPAGYRNADVGFRIVVEADEPSAGHPANSFH